MPLPRREPGEGLQGGLTLRGLSPYALRWIAIAGAAGAFVVGISGQAIRGHHRPAGPDNSSAAVRAAISDTSTVNPPRGAPALRAVAIPSLRNAPRPRRHPHAKPAAAVLVAATPTPTPAPAAATPAPPPVVVAPAPPPPAVKAPPKPSAPARGPGFDSSG